MSRPAVPRASQGFHHVAYACRDAVENHRFYGEILGLPLLNTEVQRFGDACIRHMFYDTGDGSCIAFFELSGAGEPAPLRTAVSTDLGLPLWVNHVALRADAEQVAAARDRLEAAGIAVDMELDHGWCDSIYFTDPNGILVELCVDRPGGMPVDPSAAHAQLRDEPEASEADAD